MYKYQKGQALLMVILVMVVALTVGLSVAARTTTNIRVTSDEENSQRAFSAAEAGIERAIVNSANNSAQLSNNTSYTTALSTLSGAGFVLNNGTIVLRDEPVDVWLSDYSTNSANIYLNPWSGNLTIDWGQASDVCSAGTDNTTAALEIVLITGTKASPKVTTYAFDPCSSRSASPGNGFTAPTKPGDLGFSYKTIAISVTNGLIARIIPLYAPTLIGVEGSVNLPNQGTVVSSVGISDTTKRKIVSFRGYPKLPVELFPYIFFSPTNP